MRVPLFSVCASWLPPPLAALPVAAPHALVVGELPNVCTPAAEQRKNEAHVVINKRAYNTNQLRRYDGRNVLRVCVFCIGVPSPTPS